MEEINYFENSVFIDNKIINKKMNLYFRIISDIFQINNIEAGVYLTGSLARREPSILKRNNKEVELFSDIDLMVLQNLPDNFHGDKLKKILDDIFPSFKNSVMFFPVKKNRCFKSFIGYDLKKSLSYPIYLKGKCVEVSFDKLIEHDGFELIVHQIGNFILNPCLYKSNNMSNGEIIEFSKLKLDRDYLYCKIKLLLECLRAQLIQEENITYNEVYKKRKEKPLSEIMQEEMIEKLIYMRENFQFGLDNSLNVDIISIVQKSILILLGISNRSLNEKTERSILLIDYITNNIENSTLMEKYQYLLVCYFFTNDTDKNLCKDWEVILNKLIKKYSLLFPMVKKAYNKDKVDSVLKTHDKNELNKLFLLLRYNYMELLTIKNTGEMSLLDIK